MSLRILKPVPGHRGVEVQTITGPSAKELEEIGRRIAKDLLTVVDMIDAKGMWVRRIK